MLSGSCEHTRGGEQAYGHKEHMPSYTDFVESLPWQVFLSDGEQAEPLGARLAKDSCRHVVRSVSVCKRRTRQEQGTLAGLKACLRCHCHASIKALEKALESSPEVAALLADWIHAYSSNDGANPGGFARAVRNSDKLREQFSEFQKLDEATASLGTMSYAPQRFGTLMQVATCIVKNIRPIFDMLAELKVGKNKLSSWAGKLLRNCFRADRLILFALISEFSETATKYSRAFDNVKEQGRSISNISRTAHLIDSLEARLRELFSFRDKEGALQKPLVLQDAYNGHLQRVKETWNFFHTRKLLVQGEMVFYSAGLGSEEMAVWVARQLGVLQNVLNLYIQGVRAEYDDLLASALSPFDIHHWRTRSDQSLWPPEIMCAIACCFCRCCFCSAAAPTVLACRCNSGRLSSNLFAGPLA